MARAEIQTGLTKARARIAEIDREYDAIAVDALSKAGVKPRSASGWQEVWDRFPDLYAARSTLLAERGALQQVRDGLEAKLAVRARPRKPRYTKCPTCGFTSPA